MVIQNYSAITNDPLMTYCWWGRRSIMSGFGPCDLLPLALSVFQSAKGRLSSVCGKWPVAFAYRRILRQRKGTFTSCKNGQFLGGHKTTLSSALAIISVEDDKAVLLQTSWMTVQSGELTCVLRNIILFLTLLLICCVVSGSVIPVPQFFL